VHRRPNIVPYLEMDLLEVTLTDVAAPANRHQGGVLYPDPVGWSPSLA
jgi:hypothetical protein